MLDIEIYLDVLEFIDAAAGGEVVKILFRVLSGHSEHSELSVNAQFPHSLIAACGARYKACQSTSSCCDQCLRKSDYSFP